MYSPSRVYFGLGSLSFPEETRVIVYRATIARLFPITLRRVSRTAIPRLYQSTYLGLLHATAITGLQNMLALHPEDTLVALVLASPAPVFQFR